MLTKAFAILLIALTLLPGRMNAQALPDEDFEDIYVFLRIERIGGYEISAIYSYETERLYLPVMELFRVLQINYTATAFNDVISGFFLDEDLLYRIDYPAREILFGPHTIPLTDDDILQTINGLFLYVGLFGPVFGLDCQFSFRSMSVTLRTDLELPAIREMRLRQMRQNVERLRGVVKADTTLYRRYHVARMGMVDWSVFSTQFDGVMDDTRLSAGFGTEFLGGEANLFLNLSSRDGFDERRQQYQWRWVNNDTRLVKQVRAGKLSSQAISSIYAPILGASATNTPSTYRRSFGEYTLADFTEPGWTVELFVNNVLIDFVTADASGFFQFDVPMVYGTTQVMLKFYGPYGEERTREQYLNIPYNFIPQGELEYTITGGMVQDRDNTLFARGQAFYGLTRGLTIGGGYEYLSNEPTVFTQAIPVDGDTPDTQPLEIPFFSMAANLFGNFMLSGEYAHGVRSRARMSYRLPSNMVFELDYSLYEQGQRAIRFTYLEERRATLSIPVRLGPFRMQSRMGFRQNVYEQFTYNTADALLSTSIGRVSTTVSGYATWIDQRTPYISSTLAMSVRLPRNFVIRSQAQFDVTGGSIINMKADLEKRLGRTGWLSVGYEENVRMNLRSVNMSFRYDLPFTQLAVSSRLNRESVATTQGARGSIALGSGHGHIHTDNRSMVGRGGLTIMPFVDTNHNGVRDPGEPLATGLNVRLNGGRTLPSQGDSLIRIVDLEPYTSYHMQLDESSLENITWRLRHKTISVYADPNQFKRLEIPVLPMGEASGTVYIIRDGRRQTIGRVLINFYHEDGRLFRQTMSEPDGYYTFMEFPPGNYYMAPDFDQLGRMNVTAEQERIDFEILPDTWGDIVYGLDMVLIADPTDTPEVAIVTPQPVTVVEPEPELQPDLATQELQELSDALSRLLDAALRLFVRAQRAVMTADLSSGMVLVDQSLSLFVTGQALALKGTIYYLTGQIELARIFWYQARGLIPDMEIPDVDDHQRIMNRE